MASLKKFKIQNKKNWLSSYFWALYTMEKKEYSIIVHLLHFAHLKFSTKLLVSFAYLSIGLLSILYEIFRRCPLKTKELLVRCETCCWLNSRTIREKNVSQPFIPVCRVLFCMFLKG